MDIDRIRKASNTVEKVIKVIAAFKASLNEAILRDVRYVIHNSFSDRRMDDAIVEYVERGNKVDRPISENFEILIKPEIQGSKYTYTTDLVCCPISLVSCKGYNSYTYLDISSIQRFGSYKDFSIGTFFTPEYLQSIIVQAEPDLSDVLQNYGLKICSSNISSAFDDNGFPQVIIHYEFSPIIVVDK